MLIVKGGQPVPKSEVIKTPSFGLNYILGGGLWSGRFHIIWGDPQAGKSTLMLHSMADAQKQGFIPVIVDAEGTMTDEWMEHCGIDMSKRIVIRSTRLEDILSVILPMLREKDSKYIFLIDSINTIVMESFYKNDDSTGAIGIYARSQTAMIQKIADELIGGVNHMVIFIAQRTMGNKGQYFVYQGKFGNAAEHWATNIIRLVAPDSSKATDRDLDDRIVSRDVTWTIGKSKQKAVQGTKGSYWFNPQTAEIDHSREAFHLAVRNGVIKKKGAWFEFDGETYHGEKKLLEALTDEDMQWIFDELLKLDDLDFDIDESLKDIE